jgi:hypothetical protein
VILFDTSAVVDFLRGGKETRTIVESAEAVDSRIAITTVSLFELLSPIEHRRLRREERAVRTFAQQSLILGLDFNAAAEAAKIMGGLLRLGTPINALDVLISGIAIANGAEKLVTADRDFDQVGRIAEIEINFI